MDGEALARCDREIAEIQARDETAPAWLVTLGMMDWEMERRYLLTGSTPNFPNGAARSPEPLDRTE
jgi:hypothetical protein